MAILGYKGQAQFNYPLSDPQGFPGEFKHIIRAQPYINAGNEQPKQSTIAVSGDTGEITLTINNDITLVVPYETDNATTAQSVVDAIESEPLITNITASANSGTVTITGRYPGDDFAIQVSAETSANLTFTEEDQAATTSDFISYGLFVTTSGFDRIQPISSDSDRLVGVLGHTSIQQSYENLPYEVARGETGDVLEVGDVIVQTETDFAEGDAVYVRFQNSNSSGTVGAVSNSGGADFTEAVARARPKSSSFLNQFLKLVRLQLDA